MSSQITVQLIDQHETERLLDASLSHGDKSKLADLLGVSLSEISQQVNPNEMRKSDFFKFKRFLRALCDVNADAAELIVSDLRSSLRCWLGKGHTGSLAQLTCSVNQEASEFVAAHIQHKPVHIQRKELLDIRAAVDRCMAALDEPERKGSVIAQDIIQPQMRRRAQR